MGSDSSNRSGGLSVKTLAISSFAALMAAIVVSLFWERGTLIATAITPVIVALVAEGLARPASKIEEVASAVVTRPPTSGERREGSGVAPPGATLETEARGVRPDDDETGPPEDARPSRYIAIALVTGLLAFVIAAVVLTGTELVTGRSLGTDGRTTLFQGSKGSRSQEGGEPQSGQTPGSPTDQQGGTGEVNPAAPGEEQPEAVSPEQPEEDAHGETNEAIAPAETGTTP